MEWSCNAVMAGAILLSSSAFACPRSADQLICPGDTVVSSDNMVGTILAVNPYENTIAFRSDYSGSVHTRPLESLALGMGCVRGTCVADTVISSDNMIGRVLAVNPFNGDVAFRSNYSGSVYTRNAESFSSAEYCDTYGDYQRPLQRFPLVDERLHISVDIKFSQRRPQLL